MCEARPEGEPSTALSPTALVPAPLPSHGRAIRITLHASRRALKARESRGAATQRHTDGTFTESSFQHRPSSSHGAERGRVPALQRFLLRPHFRGDKIFFVQNKKWCTAPLALSAWWLWWLPSRPLPSIGSSRAQGEMTASRHDASPQCSITNSLSFGCPVLAHPDDDVLCACTAVGTS